MIPDDVEKIIMTKEDYDRNVEQLLLDECKAELEIERLNKELEDLEKLNNANYQSFIEVNNIINELENRDDVLEEFEDWLERQKTRNSEWDNFVMVDGRLGIPISYLLNKLQELKGADKE